MAGRLTRLELTCERHYDEGHHFSPVPLMSSRAAKTFISYSTEDRGFVASMCDSLLLMGMPIWFDRLEIPPSPDISDTRLRRILGDSIQSSTAVRGIMGRWRD